VMPKRVTSLRSDRVSPSIAALTTEYVARPF
jgi:hypothetical protein